MKNKIKFHLAVTFLLIPFVHSIAQNKTVSGYISDSGTGEKLIGATVYDLKSKKGTVANNYGFFSLSLPAKDSILLQVTYIGYQEQLFVLTSSTNEFLNVKLDAGTTMQEVKIYGTKETPIDKRAEMSIIEIPVNKVASLPAMGGEPDLMKAIQLMPGVQSGNEGTSGFYVRGGSPDQNLILLDDVPLYYVSHLGGFVSIFNTDAINNVKLTKGGFPARYGGRLSSVVDIRMKDGNMQKIKGSGMIGIVSSKISVEGPIVKDKASFMVSARRFLLDIFARPVIQLMTSGDETFGYNFYDFNAKVNYKITDKDRAFLSLYSGDDKVFFKYKSNFGDVDQNDKGSLKWGNTLGAVRWNHIYSPKLFSNTLVSYTSYRNKSAYDMKSESDELTQRYKESFFSGIEDVNGKIDFEYFPFNEYTIRFGGSSIYHTFKPDVQKYKQTDNGQTSIDSTFNENQYYSWEHSSYLENEVEILNIFTVNAGIHASTYSINNKTYNSIEPRAMINTQITQNLAFKLSYAEMKQYIHLLAYSGTGMPSDLWMPSTDRVSPSRSKQYAAGIAKSLDVLPIEISVEAYYKEIEILIAYKEGASLNSGTIKWEDKIETGGYGESKGLELFIQKQQGKTTGWIGYTLSETTRQFENINNGKEFPFKYDRRHDFEITINHKLNDRINLSAIWVYGTGNPITLEIGQYYLLEDNYADQIYNDVRLYGETNSFRMASYHRLDLGVNFTKKKKWGERIWNLSVYNVYNRRNPYYYFWEREGEYLNEFSQVTQKLYQQSLFPFIPSLSYSFKFD